MFPKQIIDELGVLGGVTGARSVRADDGLLYVVKDEATGAGCVRASEYLWLSLAKIVGLACAAPEIFVDQNGRKLVGTRREHNLVGSDTASCQSQLLTGKVLNGGSHLSRIYAFDLFSANWDRHPGNYLVLNEAGVMVVFAIDFSHALPDPTAAVYDPVSVKRTATRAMFPPLVAPYGVDANAALDLLDRLGQLPLETVEAILRGLPDEWLSPFMKVRVQSFWKDGQAVARLALIRQGVQNGTLI